MTKAFAFARPSTSQGVTAKLAGSIILGIAAFCWFPHLTSPLSLDETLTYWVIRDGLGQTIDRTLHFQPQPAYYVLMWFWTQLAGVSEVALRLPSLIAALAACVAIAQLGRRLTNDLEAGLITALVFASTFNVFRESVDARSYMLGLVMLLGLTLCLLRWLDEGGSRDAIWLGVLGALLPHFHLFFALIYPALALFVFLRWSGSRATLRQAGLIGVFLGLGALFYFPVGMMLANQGGSYSFVPLPKWRSLFGVFVWSAPVAGLLAGTALSGLFGDRPMTSVVESVDSAASDADSDSASDAESGSQSGSEPGATSEFSAAPLSPFKTGALLATWMFVPLLLLFIVSLTTGFSVFLGRYLIAAIPAVCLFYALALRRIPSAWARIIAVAVMVIAALVTNQRTPDDFRGAARSVTKFVSGDSSIPVLLASGLIETEDERWLRDETLAGYLKAPTAYYPIEGRIVTLPRRLQGHVMASEIVGPVLRKGKRFAVVEWYGNGARALDWIGPRADRQGYVIERHSFGAVRVAFFRR